MKLLGLKGFGWVFTTVIYSRSRYCNSVFLSSIRYEWREQRSWVEDGEGVVGGAGMGWWCEWGLDTGVAGRDDGEWAKMV